MIAILSDIHGNLFAFRQVAEDMKRFDVDGVIFLGDLIDYGMQSNEACRFMAEEFGGKIICSLWGNHERAILTGDYSGFSSQRGVESAKHTALMLSDESRQYLETSMDHTGNAAFALGDKSVFAVHGSLEDRYWRSIEPQDVRGDYRQFDIVLSGHSHCPHLFARIYDAEDPDRRNRKSVLFINPGSVGQPRNHHPLAQYVLWDPKTSGVLFRSVEYDIEAAMALFDGSVDDFYRRRLKFGV